MVSNFLKKHTRFRNCAGVFLLFILSFNASAQLDSASVSLNLANVLDPADSNVVINVLNVDVFLNDTDYFGEIVVTMYQAGTDYPLMMQKFTKQEALNGQYLIGNHLIVPFNEVDSAGAYRMETQVRNYQGANLPLIVTNFNN